MSKFALCLNCSEIYSDMDKNELDHRCPKANCGDKLIYADESMIGLLMILNKKGYRMEKIQIPNLWDPHISITFDKYIVVPTDKLPDNFEVEYYQHHIVSLSGEERTIIRDRTSDDKCEVNISNITDKQKIIFDMINLLLTWAHDLPQNTQIHYRK